jgi:hypothetical protein
MFKETMVKFIISLPAEISKEAIALLHIIYSVLEFTSVE